MNRHPSADRMSAMLTFVLLAGGTAAVGAEWLGLDRPAAPAAPVARVVQLPAVEVMGRRAAAPVDGVAALVATLPAVTVTGRREAHLSSVAPLRLRGVSVHGRRADALMTAASSQAVRSHAHTLARCVEAAPAMSRTGRDV
jgi:hypothetical protein